MRTLAAIGAFLVGAVLIGMLMAPVASAGSLPAPALQTTTTATADAAVTAVATAVATAAATADAAATAVATATVAPGSLPNTSGETGMGGLGLAGVALLITGLALAIMFAGRRSANT